MKLSILLKRIMPIQVNGAGDPDVKGISYDSRKVRPGVIFFALHGQHYDGNEFMQDAIDRGAIAVITERSPADCRTKAISIHVLDARKSMAEAACTFYGQPSEKLQVTGITGTNGKTTIAYMVRDIFAAAGYKPGLITTVVYQVGDRAIPADRTTPEAPDLQDLLSQMVNIGCKSVAIEVSSHALVQKRVIGIDFDVGVFSNLTHDHLDYHRTVKEYFHAKTLLFRMLASNEKRSFAVINLDDEHGRRLARMKDDIHAELITYGFHPDATVRAVNLKLSSSGSIVEVRSPWGNVEMRLKLLGRFNVSNALAAFASCACKGVEPQCIADVLSDMCSVPGRLEEVPTDLGFHVFIDYAHTDDALKNVLSTLREITANRLIAVFGCGGNRDKKKRPLMGKVVSSLADYAVLTSDNPRKEEASDIILQIQKGFEKSSQYEIVVDRRQAVQKALSIAGKGDVVIVAGKGHENYQELADTIIPFDDKQVVREYID